jgi:Salmonella virulence plasmid 65kDa B protein
MSMGFLPVICSRLFMPTSHGTRSPITFAVLLVALVCFGFLKSANAQQRPGSVAPPVAPMLPLPGGPAINSENAQRQGSTALQGGNIKIPLQGERPQTSKGPHQEALERAGQITRRSATQLPQTQPQSDAKPTDPKAQTPPSAAKAQPGQQSVQNAQNGPADVQPAGVDEPDKKFMQAQEPPMNGSFTQTYSIDVPAFRGLEPKLRLLYDSNAGTRSSGIGSSLVGHGWTLDGLSEITRVSRIRGAPRFNAADTFTLDGEEMVACAAGMTSPSCTTGGTHATRVESYRRITYQQNGNTWTVTARDGTAYLYQAVAMFPNTGSPDPQISTGYRWLLQTATDTHGNVVTYNYTCDQLPSCRPTTITYNGTVITFHLENRPDVLTHATGKNLAVSSKRIKTIDITTGGQRVRSYAFSHEQSPATGTTRLISIQQYGRDAVLNGQGVVTGGSSLPATTYTYANPTFDLGPAVTYQSPYSDGSNGNVRPTIRATGDFNGDGRLDVVFLSTPQPQTGCDTSSEAASQCAPQYSSLIILYGSNEGLKYIPELQPPAESRCYIGRVITIQHVFP